MGITTKATAVLIGAVALLATRGARAADDGASEVATPIVTISPAPAPPTTPAPRAATDEAPTAPARGGAALGRKQDFWRFALGPRVNLVRSAGFDPFAGDDALAQLTLEAARTLLVAGRVSFSAGVAWDIGNRTGSSARGDQASLVVNRFSAPLEGRVHAFPWLYGFARLAPGAALARASVKDPSSTTQLVGGGWAFTADMSAGAAFLLGSHRSPEKKLARVWIAPEAGYAWSTAIPMHLSPDDRGDDPRPVGESDLGSLALTGPFFRTTVAMTF